MSSWYILLGNIVPGKSYYPIPSWAQLHLIEMKCKTIEIKHRIFAFHISFKNILFQKSSYRYNSTCNSTCDSHILALSLEVQLEWYNDNINNCMAVHSWHCVPYPSDKLDFKAFQFNEKQIVTLQNCKRHKTQCQKASVTSRSTQTYAKWWILQGTKLQIKQKYAKCSFKTTFTSKLPLFLQYFVLRGGNRSNVYHI